MDHAKTTIPYFANRNKIIDSFARLPVLVTDMIAPRHGNVKYAYYLLDLYKADAN
jgi:hypothetical protein